MSGGLGISGDEPKAARGFGRQQPQSLHKANQCLAATSREPVAVRAESAREAGFLR